MSSRHSLLPKVLLWTCVLSTSCRRCDEQLNEAPGNLEGIFCEPVSGAGLARVEVSLLKDGNPVAGKTAGGDVVGHFSILNVPPGTYKVVGTLGDITREHEATIESDKTLTFVDEGCHAPPIPPPPLGGHVTGRVCDAGGGAWVTFGQAWLSSPGNAGDIAYPSSTDGDGRYDITGVNPGTYDLHVTKGGFSQDVANVTVTEGNETAIASPTECAPLPTGSVEGSVCQEAHGWVSGGRVYINLTGGTVAETTTDSSGHFRLDNIPPGSQVVRVEKDVFTRSYAVTVTGGGVTQVPSPAECNIPPPPPETGSVVGRVCAPDGHTWLAGANVYVGDPANPASTSQTDADGNFTLTGVPAGAQTVHVTKNSFTATYSVTVPANGSVTIPVSQCQVVPTATRVAVVSGDYDNVRCVLTGQGDPLASRAGDPCSIPGLGLNPANVTTISGTDQPWAAGLLGDYARMSQFDIIFFNCGVHDDYTMFGGKVELTTGPNSGAYRNNLRQFVEAGGSVYASDWAAPIIEFAFPEFVTWQAGTLPGAADSPQAAKIGDRQQITASVVDPGIRAALGQNTVHVSFDLDAWVAMASTAPATRVYIRGTATAHPGANLFSAGTLRNMTDIPLTVGFDVGQGRVVFTSFHQERNLTPDMQQVLNLLVFEL